MKSQHEAVIVATKEIFGNRFEAGMDVKTIATKEDKAKVTDRVIKMFQDGDAVFSEEAKVKYSDAKELKVYVAGLVTNWWNKSKELNGNVKYEAKNPGVRAGSNDEQVKEMRNLQKRLEAAGNTAGAAQVAEAITARIAELKAESSTKALPKVDLTKIPEHLRSLIEEEV